MKRIVVSLFFCLSGCICLVSNENMLEQKEQDTFIDDQWQNDQEEIQTVDVPFVEENLQGEEESFDNQIQLEEEGEYSTLQDMPKEEAQGEQKILADDQGQSEQEEIQAVDATAMKENTQEEEEQFSGEESFDDQIQLQEKDKNDARDEEEASPFLEDLDIYGQGNWVKKRITFENAQRVYQEIKKSVAEIASTQLPFFNTRTQLDAKVFNLLYQKTGYTAGEIKHIVRQLLEKINERASLKGHLNNREREFKKAIIQEEEALKKIEADVKLIGEIEQTIDQALTKLLEIVAQSQAYEDDAWKFIQRIGKELDDKKVSQYYAEIEVVKKNVNNIEKYVQNDFSRYFSQVILLAKERTNELLDKFASLKKRGFNLKNQLQAIEENASIESSEKREDRVDESGRGEKKVTSDTDNDSNQHSGLFAYVYQLIINSFYAAYQWLLGMFWG